MKTKSSGKKVRSLILAMMMVLSVFGGTIAIAGSAAANAPGNNQAFDAGNAPGDSTQTTDTTQGLNTEIANITFQSPGNVTNVEVNASNGTDATGISPSDIRRVNVTLVDSNNNTVESNQVTYDSDNVNVSFDGNATDGNDVEGLRVTAEVAGSASDGDVIDAGVIVRDTQTGTAFEGTSPYDTAGSQTVVVTDTFASAQVKRTGAQGSSVNDATVQFINDETGTIIAEDTTDTSGATASVRVPPNVNLTATATKGGFTQSSSRVAQVPEGQSLELDVTITPQGVPKNITVIAEEPDSETAIANGTDTVTYYAQVTGDFGQQTDQPLNGFDVSATENDASVDVTPTTDTTQEVVLPNGSTANGTVEFAISDSEAEQPSIKFSVDDNTSVNTSVEPNFRNARGNAVLQGEVTTNESEIVQDATVWVAYDGQNQTLANAQESAPFLVSGVDSEGKYTIEGIDASQGEVNIYVDAPGFNGVNLTDTSNDLDFVAANETEKDLTGGQTQNHDITIFPGGPAQEFRLNVTVDDGNKAVDVPEDGQVTADVSVEQRPEGSSTGYVAAENQEIAVSTVQNGTLSPETTNVTTDDNGSAQVTFSAENTGATNITALTENRDSDNFSASGSEEANVAVFGTAEITGDVVNEDDEPLAAGQATVQLFVNRSDTFEPVQIDGTNRTSEIGSGGSYVFTNVRSGERYQMVATADNVGTDNQTVGSATTVENVPAGTTTNDIVVVGVEPDTGSGLSGAAAEYDADQDGQISIGELGTAATDFSNDEISITELSDVATAYSS
jgi:surface glycoprotein (TIGR04207 family)